MNFLCLHLSILFFISSAECGTLLNFFLGKSEVTTSQPMPVVKPLHEDQQNYLEDNANHSLPGHTEVNYGRDDKRTMVTKMRDMGNGVYEFEVDGDKKCKFYVDRRQTQRSLMCNAKQCSLHSKTWRCSDVNLNCSIADDLKKAECMKGREIINAPSRSACPKGERRESGVCRTPF